MWLFKKKSKKGAPKKLTSDPSEKGAHGSSSKNAAQYVNVAERGMRRRPDVSDDYYSSKRKIVTCAQLYKDTGITVNLPLKDENGNSIDWSDADFSGFAPDYYGHRAPKKDLSKLIFDSYKATLKEATRIFDKDFFAKITNEYTFSPILTAFVCFTASITIGSTLSLMGAPEEQAKEMLNAFWESATAQCDETFSHMKKQKKEIFISCYDAFSKIVGQIIRPRCIWTCSSDLTGFYASTVAFGDMLCSENVAKDYEKGDVPSFPLFSVPPYQSDEFAEKVTRTVNTVSIGMINLSNLIKAEI